MVSYDGTKNGNLLLVLQRAATLNNTFFCNGRIYLNLTRASGQYFAEAHFLPPGGRTSTLSRDLAGNHAAHVDNINGRDSAARELCLSKHLYLGIEGTESTVLQRNNTCTTYISMKRKNCNRVPPCNHQLPVRSVSLMRNSNQNGSRRTRYNNVVDEQI